MKAFIAEALGTFCLVFCGTAAIVVNDIYPGNLGHAGIAVVFGLIVAGMIYAFGETSGAHINPAVTVAFAVAKKFKWRRVPGYILAQSLGAVAASGLVMFLFPMHETLGGTFPATDVWRVFVLEFILTFILMLVIINVATGSKEVGIMAGAAIGGIVLLEAMFAGPVTGASMNPARSLAPALVSMNLQHLWIYVTAPVLGAILAVISCSWVKDENCC